MRSQPCTVVALKIIDENGAFVLDKSASSPALAALVQEGWLAKHSVVIEAPEPTLHLLMFPPYAQASKTDWTHYAALGFLLVNSGLMAGILWGLS